MKLRRLKDIIIYEDDNLIAVNKPAGVYSLQSRFGTNRCIQDLAEAHDPNLQLCHRLDKDTSGVLLLAKNPDTYRSVAMMFEKREIKKTYWAIAHGRHYFENRVIDIPLSTTSRGRAKIDRHGGKPAETLVTAIENFKKYTLIECHPSSGRLHQIRIHLSSQNAPIVADTLYGGELPYLRDSKANFSMGRDKEERPMISRTCLHAYQVSFELDGKNIDIEADLPKDFHVCLKLIRKYDSI